MAQPDAEAGRALCCPPCRAELSKGDEERQKLLLDVLAFMKGKSKAEREDWRVLLCRAVACRSGFVNAL